MKAYLEGKGVQAEIADIFGMSVNSLRRYLIGHERDDDLVPKPHPGRLPTLEKEDLQWIKAQVEAKADIELKALCSLLSQQRGKLVSVPTMCRACQHLDLRRKKKSYYAVEQERDEVKKAPRLPRHHRGVSTASADFH